MVYIIVKGCTGTQSYSTDRLIASHSDIVNDILFVTAAILDFYLQG